MHTFALIFTLFFCFCFLFFALFSFFFIMLGTRRYTMSYFPYGRKMVRDIFINVVIYAINSVHEQEDNLFYFDVDEKFS
jgi:hypothetical protein